MEEPSPSNYESQATTLRAELKRWEGEWAVNHEGNKPTRGDIKQNTAIGTVVHARMLSSEQNH